MSERSFSVRYSSRMRLAQMRLAARNLAISSKKSMCELKKNERCFNSSPTFGRFPRPAQTRGDGSGSQNRLLRPDDHRSSRTLRLRTAPYALGAHRLGGRRVPREACTGAITTALVGPAIRKVCSAVRSAKHKTNERTTEEQEGVDNGVRLHHDKQGASRSSMRKTCVRDKPDTRRWR